MRVLVAGAGGAVGSTLVPLLVERGHDVVGIARSHSKKERIRQLGAQPVIVDALDSRALDAAVKAAAPEVVIHALKAIPQSGPRRYRDMAETHRLHVEGTRNLLGAARRAGTRRFIAESIIMAYGYADHGDVMLTEEHPRASAGRNRQLTAALKGIAALEDPVLEAGAAGQIEGVVGRFGIFYGAGAGSDLMIKMLKRRMLPVPRGVEGVWSMIHIIDVARSLVALAEASSPGPLYNIVDDEPVAVLRFVSELAARAGAPAPTRLPVALIRLGAPYYADTATMALRVSNARIRAELGWQPELPTFREGVAHTVAQLGQCC